MGLGHSGIRPWRCSGARRRVGELRSGETRVRGRGWYSGKRDTGRGDRALADSHTDADTNTDSNADSNTDSNTAALSCAGTSPAD